MSITGTKGVDISYAQGDINMSKVKAAGYGWVMIRCAQGTRITDNWFATNVKKAEANGMPWGAYLLTEATTTAQAKAEVALADKLIKAQIAKGYKPTLPIAIDIEEAGFDSWEYTPSILTNTAKVWVDEMKKLGYYPMIYTGYFDIRDNISTSVINSTDVWLAEWGRYPDYTKSNLGFWQYGGETNLIESNSISGVGVIDKDLAYKDYPTIIKNGGYNGWSKSSGGSTTTTTTPPTTTTKPATSTGNPAIKEVQTWLNKNYKTGLVVDGCYGAKTKAALVKALQTELNKQNKAGLVIDGVYGNKTNAAVFNLSVGSRGNITKVLQGLLICNGLGTNGFDGVYGNGTKTAVTTYQRNKGLTVDGIAGKQTFSKLCK